MQERIATIFLILVIILLSTFAATSCFGQDAADPKRIVSLGPTLTKQIYLLDAQDKLVGITTYCPDPDLAQKKEKVGTLLDADLEKIVHLEPDLVLATSLTGAKTKQKLRNLEIEVVEFSLAKNFSQICTQFLELGRIVGKENEAQEIIRRTKEQVDIIRERVKNLPHPLVFVQVGAEPLFTMNEDSFFNDYIESAGGVNIATDSKTGLYSQELVLQNNPDVIIITAMGIAGEREKELWENFPTLKAARNNRIYIVDADRFCSPTPVEFAAALEEMVKILHSENE